MPFEGREVYTLLKAVSGFLSITLLKEDLGACCKMEQEELVERVERMLESMPEFAHPRNRLSSMQPPVKATTTSHASSEPIYDDTVQIDEEHHGRTVSASSSYMVMGASNVTVDTTHGVDTISESNQEIYADADVDNAIAEETYEPPPCEGNLLKVDGAESEATVCNGESGPTTSNGLIYDALKTEAKDICHFAPWDVSKNSLLSGTLWKHKKKFLTNWHRRFCIVKENFLFYFRSETEDKEKGVIVLPGYNIAMFGPNKEKRFGFSLEPRNVKRDCYQFIVGTKEEVEPWMKILEPICAQDFSIDHNDRLRSLSVKSKSTEVDENPSSTETSAGEPFSHDAIPEQDEIYDNIEESSNNEDMYEVEPGTPVAVLPPPADVSSPSKASYVSSSAGADGNTAQNNTPAVDEDIYDVIPADEEIESTPDKAQPIHQHEAEPVSEAAAPSPPPPRNMTTSPTATADLRGNRATLPSDSSTSSPPLLPDRRIGNRKESRSSVVSSSPHVAASPPLPARTNTTKRSAVQAPSEIIAPDLFSLDDVYVGLEDKEPSAEDELAFNKGDIIYITDRVDTSWWIGCANGRVGLVLNRYLTSAFPSRA